MNSSLGTINYRAVLVLLAGEQQGVVTRQKWVGRDFMRWKGIKEKWLAVVQQTDANTIWHKQLFVLAATANALWPELWLGGSQQGGSV